MPLIPRLFQATSLSINAFIQLDVAASHHVSRVLRKEVGDMLIVFNGIGGEYIGKISHINKKLVTVHLKQYEARDMESPLDIWLAQGISKGDKMDYVIQKTVELGIKKIIPLLTERCQVKLDKERSQKRLSHWQSIVISACEQCGRSDIPEIILPV